MQSMDEAPVLIIAFNRPKYLKQVLSTLKQAGVKRLFVFRDGPRPLNQDDRRLGREIEEMVNAIDWPCDVKTNFLNNNLGCGWGPFTAISWAFQYTDRLIILEDDCVPSKSFFDFCNQFLEKYKDEPKVRHISGYSQFPESDIFRKYDYIFTQYAPTWGWATWKRVWDNCDMHERLIAPFFRNGGFKGQFSSAREDAYFNKYYWQRTSPLVESTHSWDYQYAVHSKMNGALSIVPAKNLIDYIGVEGTHGSDSSYYGLTASSDFEIQREPGFITLDKDYEMAYFKRYCTMPFLRSVKLLARRLKNKCFGRADFPAAKSPSPKA